MDTVTEAPKSHCCHNTHMQIVTLASYILILEREIESPIISRMTYMVRLHFRASNILICVKFLFFLIQLYH